MSRKSRRIRSHGFNDVIGVALLAAALLLLVAQLSFDRYDLSFFKAPAQQAGAQLDRAVRRVSGLGFVSSVWVWRHTFCRVLFAAFGVAYLLNFLGYLRERLRWSLLWSVVLVISLTGLLYMLDNGGWLGNLREDIGTQSAGGWLGS